MKTKTTPPPLDFPEALERLAYRRVASHHAATLSATSGGSWMVDPTTYVYAGENAEQRAKTFFESLRPKQEGVPVSPNAASKAPAKGRTAPTPSSPPKIARK